MPINMKLAIDAELKRRQAIQLERLYKELSTVRADLVSSCGASDLCLVEGDSLLAEILSDSSLDWEHGGQFLQLTYLAEKYLKSLKQCGAVFRILFIDENSAMWSGQPSKLLARELLQRHLELNTDFEVDRIKSWAGGSADGDGERSASVSDEKLSWEQYLESTNPAFILIADGEQLPEDSAVVMRQFLIDSLCKGFNIVYTQLGYESNRVFGYFVHAASQGIKGKKLSEWKRHAIREALNEMQSVYKINGVKNSLDAESFAQLIDRLGLRRAIFIQAAADTIKEIGVAAEQPMKLYLLHLTLLAHLPLNLRAHQLAEVQDSNALQHVRKCLDVLIKHSIGWLRMSDGYLRGIATHDERKGVLSELADYADGRLFFKLLERVRIPEQPADELQVLVSKLGFTPTMAEDALLAWQHISPGSMFLPVGLNGLHHTRVHAEIQARQCHQLQKVTSDLAHAVLGDTLAEKLAISKKQEQEPIKQPSNAADEDLDWESRFDSDEESDERKDSVVDNSGEMSRPSLHYNEDYHWHTGVNLDRDFRQHNETNSRFAQKYIKFMHSYAESLEGTILHLTGASYSASASQTTGEPASQNKVRKAPKQTNNKKGVSRKKQLCDTNAARRIKEAEEAARMKLESVAERASDILLEKRIKDINQFISECKVPIVALEANIKKLRLYAQNRLDVEQLQKTGVESAAKSDTFLNTQIEVFALIQHIVEDNEALIDVHLLDTLGRSLTWLGFDDAAQSLRAHPVKWKSSPASASLASDLHNIKAILGQLEANPPLSAVEFQLTHMGHLFSRKSYEGQKDPRVEFIPDEWQVKLLDVVDRNGSALVCAPTSSGKTFISYYCMEKVLRDSDDGVVVYVSPTKALVNQVAAEVYARFRNKTRGSLSVFGIFTRDYRYKPLHCRILVTVPACLEILLLSPINRKSWNSRLRYVIFDEVHSIANSSEGPTWERLLLLINCPYLALSATVGNPESFHRWLHSSMMYQELQKQRHIEAPSQQLPSSTDTRKKGSKQPTATPSNRSYEVALISHTERYADLSKSAYVPAGGGGFHRIHPYAALNLNRVSKSGIARDLVLEPSDALNLYKAIIKSTSRYTLDKAHMTRLQELAPENFFKRCHAITRQEGREYEKALRQFFEELARLHPSNAKLVIEEMDNGTSAMVKSCPNSRGFIRDNVYNLIESLKSRDQLPAILFSLERNRCEAFAKAVVSELEERINKEIRELEKDDKVQKKYEKQLEKQLKAKQAKSKKKKEDDEQEPEDEIPMQDPRELQIREITMRCSYGEPGKQLSEGLVSHSLELRMHLIQHILGDQKRLTKRVQYALGKDHVLVRALELGIGVHHAGLPSSYRQAVEWLFRIGCLRVVFATGTLALGIHMPCKTVVFLEDSIYLDSLAYRQMSGRAGRRGHDLLGRVSFFGIPQSKVARLLTADLTRIRGAFPVNASLVLRCLILHNEVGPSDPEVVDAITRLFHKPLYGIDDDRHDLLVRLHFRYAVEYLIQEMLLTPEGDPINLCGLVSHLYWSEPANFFFLSLLREGLFQRICAPIFDHPPGSMGEMEILKELMLIMCHLFERVPVHRAKAKLDFSAIGPSKVILEDLPTEVASILEKHNERSLSLLYSLAASLVADLPPDCTLPASNINVPINSGAKEEPLSQATPGSVLQLLETECIKYRVRSSFIANSGHGDNFGSVAELEHEARSEAFVHREAIPTVTNRGIRDRGLILNRYALDFLTHGQFKMMTVANGLYGGQSWEVLRSFELVLRAISTALRALSAKEDQLEEILEEEDSEDSDPVRRVSNIAVVQAFFRLSSVFSALFKKHYRR